MANWQYFINGKWWLTDSTGLKELAEKGVITSETYILTWDGRQCRAGEIKGLKFGVKIEPPPKTNTAVVFYIKSLQAFG
ncbi:MAG: hypothetical protein LBU34_10295 [Planctomycetaceae bacterium]|jgi:hypothetical protein|nr:hypothetical protein [Planctomycetaceae bacterium]